MNGSKKSWKDWIDLQRVVPLITATLTFVAIAAANLGFLALSIPEQIILTVLGLLAVDALVERMRILEQIRHGLNTLSGGVEPQPSLIWERDFLRNLPPFHIWLQGVDELFVSGGSLRDLLRIQHESIRRWLSQTRDARLLLMLEDPQAARTGRTPVWSSVIDQKQKDKEKRREIYVQDIETSLRIAVSLKEEYPEKVEIRLTDEAPSATVMMLDRSKAIVCFNIFRSDPPWRPVSKLSKTEHPEWLREFEERYLDELWGMAEKWSPAGGGVTSKT